MGSACKALSVELPAVYKVKRSLVSVCREVPWLVAKVIVESSFDKKLGSGQVWLWSIPGNHCFLGALATDLHARHGMT